MWEDYNHGGGLQANNFENTENSSYKRFKLKKLPAKTWVIFIKFKYSTVLKFWLNFIAR